MFVPQEVEKLGVESASARKCPFDHQIDGVGEFSHLRCEQTQCCTEVQAIRAALQLAGYCVVLAIDRRHEVEDVVMVHPVFVEVSRRTNLLAKISELGGDSKRYAVIISCLLSKLMVCQRSPIHATIAPTNEPRFVPVRAMLRSPRDLAVTRYVRDVSSGGDEKSGAMIGTGSATLAVEGSFRAKDVSMAVDSVWRLDTRVRFRKTATTARTGCLNFDPEGCVQTCFWISIE